MAGYAGMAGLPGMGRHRENLSGTALTGKIHRTYVPSCRHPVVLRQGAGYAFMWIWAVSSCVTQ